MTSLSTIVASLNNFNTQVSSLQTTALHNVFAGMNATKDAVAAIYSTDYINSTLNTMLTHLDELDLAPIRASLVALNARLTTLDYDTVRNQLLQIKASLVLGPSRLPYPSSLVVDCAPVLMACVSSEHFQDHSVLVQRD
jgi:hypothetical protein